MKHIATVALLLLLTACGTITGGSGSSTTSSSTAGSSTGATSTTDAADVDAAGDNPVDGATFCAFLAQSEPGLKKIGTPVGAEANFSVALANWVGEHPDQKPRTAADLDDASQKSCPKSRTAVVTDMGAASFEEALG